MAAGVKSLSKTFVWILMGLLMLGLAGFGATNLTGTVRTVATVGTQTVSVDDYARELQREIRAVEAQTGQTLPMAQARELGIDRIALANLVNLASLDNEVAELGVSIGDTNLQQEILEVPAFQGVDGTFDREGYRFALEQAGLSEADFEEDLRRESARTLVQGAIMEGVEMPSTMTDLIIDYVYARRSFTVATVSADALATPVPAPTDTQLQTYYDENTDRFTLPETKRLTYALLSPEMLLDQVELDDASVRRLFEEREAQYNQPERRLVEQLAFTDEAAALDAKAQLEVGGTTFERLVEDRELSLADVDLGDMAIEELGAAGEAIFAAEIGEVVGPLPSSLGPALYRVNGTLAARITPFEEVEAELRDELAAERARRLIEAQAEDINDLLAGGATLEELTGETEMTVGEIDWTSESSDGVAAYAGFREAAQAVRDGDFPEIGFLEDGSIFALRLNEVLPPRPEPLDSARARVAAAWTAAETNTALQSQADSVLATLVTEGDFAATGLPTRVENGLTRTAFLDGVPVDFMNQVFEMEPGELRVIGGQGRAFVVRLDDILPPEETAELQQTQAAVAAQMNQALSRNLFDVYVRDAQTRAQPTLDQRALNAVQANFQ
ncbi:peptidyl-prolyl cis-trans isomerase [Falsiruegeria mediterranea]|uniref:Peptidyl-prolyl cis-trans isomerase D n=1 Tax=Falsiruegeria mediterranea M17 TaxID=1200281 RepID=A0A2R8CAF1_9RHOB|nr:peptidyl-prolyl cis-trans isomerase [Falsiruegeria mediterranea]SPJ29363.1 Peptidyl-prolyl cis-trans isomerase D [Falsiruegeria mediterranea M17]